LDGALGALAGPRAAVWAMLGVLAVATVIVVAGPLRAGRDFPVAPAP
ncbi:MFS transporter, partial [Amycolatopsis sp. SID8362]|nr:MFS transporter [Amycolatopsis sp. SID8362]NED39974.1 MFS transporter [Amycolatopsis sp. SID8362]